MDAKKVKVLLKDGNSISVPAGSTVAAVAAAISENLARVAVCASLSDVKGERIVDLTAKLNADCTLHIFTLKDAEGQRALRHTAAHVLAAAVKNIFPTAKLGVGPAIEGGFYYDFDFATPIKSEDLSKIEAEMDRLIKLNLPVIRQDKSRAEAGRILDAAREVYKIEILNDIPRGEKISFYKIDGFADLCAGPHIPTIGKIKAFKLTRITGAYFKGDAKNKMLTRIYGVAFDKAADLADYITTQEEIKKRDHNKIGRDLEIFTTHELVGQGLPLIMPNGAKIIQILQRFVEDEEERRGYLYTRTPYFAKSDLYKVSGHWDHYKEGMFIVGNELLDEEVFALRPMTCPFQFLIYKANMHSYRELPLRYAETSFQARNESSGEMHGLIRVRQFTIADAHIIARPDQVHQVFSECIDLSRFLLRAIGLDENITFRLSKWDPRNREKYIGNPADWEKSQEEIRKVLVKNKIKFTETEGDAAFYGPKIDIQTRNVYGKEDTIITMQLDFSLAERFDMTYIDENGKAARPFIIHRTSIGCYERTLALLIEKYAGAFPVWLSPVQATVMGISNKQDDYVTKIYDEIYAAGLRVQKDLRNEKVGYKIREATMKKIPYMLVAGEKEETAGTVSVRTREGADLGTMSVREFIDKVKAQCAEFK
jgi:threonyl-tRNA synthetase